MAACTPFALDVERDDPPLIPHCFETRTEHRNCPGITDALAARKCAQRLTDPVSHPVHAAELPVLSPAAACKESKRRKVL